MHDPSDRISVDPDVCGGKPCIRGTRIWVALIVDHLVAGMSDADLLAEYPQLSRADLDAALAFRDGSYSDRFDAALSLVVARRREALRRLADEDAGPESPTDHQESPLG